METVRFLRLGVSEMRDVEPVAGEEEEAGHGGGLSTAAVALGTSASRKDIKRYKCDFCSFVRSKKSLIHAHVLEHHKDKVDGLEDYQEGGSGMPCEEVFLDCEKCGMRFKKLAHLKQHMQCHYVEVMPGDQEAGDKVLEGQEVKNQDESSLISVTKQKRPISTNPQKHPAAKRVKSPSAGRVSEMRDLEPVAGEGEEADHGGGLSTAVAALGKDIRRYKCDFCSFVQSKKSLIHAHVLEHHKDKVDGLEDYQEGGGGMPCKEVFLDCEECGMRFKKPAHLKQHLQCHSVEVMSGGQEAGDKVLEGQEVKNQDESSLISVTKRKRPLSTNPEKHPAAKRVKSPSAGSKPPLAAKSPSMRPSAMNQQRRITNEKQLKSSAAKRIRSPTVRMWHEQKWNGRSSQQKTINNSSQSSCTSGSVENIDDDDDEEEEEEVMMMMMTMMLLKMMDDDDDDDMMMMRMTMMMGHLDEKKKEMMMMMIMRWRRRRMSIRTQLIHSDTTDCDSYIKVLEKIGEAKKKEVEELKEIQRRFHHDKLIELQKKRNELEKKRLELEAKNLELR